jgi:hypothetical protein
LGVVSRKPALSEAEGDLLLFFKKQMGHHTRKPLHKYRNGIKKERQKRRTAGRAAADRGCTPAVRGGHTYFN